MDEFVEVSGKSVEVAVHAALQELGLSSVEDASVDVLQQPERGFLGIGSRPAIVRVTPKAKKKPRKRKRRSRGKGGDSKPEGRAQKSGARTQPAAAKGGREGGRRDSRQGRKQGRGDEGRRQQRPERSPGKKSEEPKMTEDVDVEEQAAVVAGFLEGLLEQFGLEGRVATRVEDDIIYADVTGGQTEALVGHRGAILQAIGDLVRTIVQRKTRARARIRLDIAGYQERRREALKIYAERLAGQVRTEGGELMLEPMNPADRKIVHDAVVELEGVRSFSEGEEPNRSVVIALAPGFSPTGSADAAAGGEEGAADEAEPVDVDDDVLEEPAATAAPEEETEASELEMEEDEIDA